MKRLVPFLLIISFVLSMFTGCVKQPPLEPIPVVQPKRLSVVDFTVDDAFAVVDKFYTYGTHFNVEGTLDVTNYFTAEALPDTEFELCIKYNDKEEDEIILPLIVDKTDTENVIRFNSAEYINEGINLEELLKKDYIASIKATGISAVYYFTLAPSDEEAPGCQPIEYYTITKKKKNNVINIGFGTCDGKEEGTKVPFLALNVSAVKELPEDVYDIVIDPGHGGHDPGAMSNDGSFDERKLNLKNAMFLKTKLEDLGFKVYMTRTSDKETEEDTVHNVYDDDGKITKAMETKAKIYLAIHMNSSGTANSYSGFEIYIAPRDSLRFARSFSKEIAKATGKNASTLNQFKIEDGVYSRGFKTADYQELVNAAARDGFKVYENVTENTPYYYFIREVGGIVTGAYTDGRNKLYSANKYRNTNQGIESYLFELSYINNDEDLDFVLKNGDKFAIGITNGLINYLYPETKK